MKRVVQRNRTETEAGFSLVEVLVAMVIALAVLGSVFGILIRSQSTFRREPEVADLNQNARVGMEMISRDLTMAGYKTPPASAILWNDGGGINPDEITIIWADPDIPTSEPIKCGVGTNGTTGPCKTLDMSSTLNIDPETMDPRLEDDTLAYSDGMILFALETDDCNGDGQRGIYPFEVTQPPNMTSAGGRPTLQVNHNPGNDDTGINMPGGFNREILPDCAIIGKFKVVQYRVSPLPPTSTPILERRDLGLGEPWVPVAGNIENLQIRYATAVNDMMDEPFPPQSNDPLTWINRVRVSVFGRTESKDLEGSSAGVFQAEDRHIRKTFSTAVSLRNLSHQAATVSAAQIYN